MILPDPIHGSRLQNFVATMRLHGNHLSDLNLPILLQHNLWTDEAAIREEWALQENGSRKLPEEVAAATPCQPEDIEE